MNIACPALIEKLNSELCLAVDIYCERSSAAFDAEPVNALTNAAFLLASWSAWRLHTRHPAASGSYLVKILIILIAVVGIGSFTFHTIGTVWAKWLDVLPILLFMLTYLWFVVTRFLQWSAGSAAAAVTVFLLATVFIEAFVPTSFLWGGAMYLPAMAVLISLASVFHVRLGPAAGRAFIIALGVFLMSYTARSIDQVWCDSLPMGTHFLWHLLNALLLFLLVRISILHLGDVRR